MEKTYKTNWLKKHQTIEFSSEITWIFPIFYTSDFILFIIFCIMSCILSIFNQLCISVFKRIIRHRRTGKLRTLILLTMKFSILIQSVFLLFLISSFNLWIIASVITGQIIGYAKFIVEDEILLPKHLKLD